VASKRQTQFELEFPDSASLRAAYKGCRELGAARVPAVSLAVGTRCTLVFVTADGREKRQLRGRVAACYSEPVAIELRLDREQRESGNPMEAVRNLSVAEQVRLARKGGQRERTALERTYGKTVWEALLANPRITAPEVARIARKGNLSQPLLAVIVENASWASSATVRRAALSHPRLTTAMAIKLLRRLPKNELKVVPKQTIYPILIRELATKLLKS